MKQSVHQAEGLDVIRCLGRPTALSCPFASMTRRTPPAQT